MKNKNEITLKEVYERVIRLETKVDGIVNSDAIAKKYFTRIAWFIVVLEVLGLIIDYFIS